MKVPFAAEMFPLKFAPVKNVNTPLSGFENVEVATVLKNPNAAEIFPLIVVVPKVEFPAENSPTMFVLPKVEFPAENSPLIVVAPRDVFAAEKYPLTNSDPAEKFPVMEPVEAEKFPLT